MNPNDQSKFEALFRRGTEMLKRGKTDRAVELLARASRLNPDHIDTAVNLSGAYILTKKFKAAVALLEPLADSGAENAMIWTNLGAAYLGNPILARDGDQLKAVEAFKKALSVNPAAPHVAYNIGLIYRDRQEYTRAIQWFNKALQTNPNDQDARSLIDRLSNQKEINNS